MSGCNLQICVGDPDPIRAPQRMNPSANVNLCYVKIHRLKKNVHWNVVCVLPANQDGGRGGRGGASPGAAGAADDGAEEDLHQVDEQRLHQERGEEHVKKKRRRVY